MKNIRLPESARDFIKDCIYENVDQINNSNESITTIKSDGICNVGSSNSDEMMTFPY